jgi:hypothetical protein
LFTDVVLTGGIDGHSLATRARSFRPGLRVLYKTGYTPTSITLDPDASLLLKPFTPAALAAKLATVLDS